MEKEINYITDSEMYVSTINAGYRYATERQEDAPKGTTLKDVVKLVTLKLRNIPTMTDEKLATSIYSLCAAALSTKDYAYRLILNKDGIYFGISGDDGDIYL